MSIVIELSSEEEGELRRIAAAAHLDAVSYATQHIRRLVQSETHPLASGSLSDDVRERIHLIREDIQKSGFNDAPFYPDEVMTREWIYGDHP